MSIEERTPFSNLEITLKIAAQKIISQYQLTNEAISQDIESSIKSAIENFDFETHVKEACERELKQMISKAIDFSTLREIINKKVNDVLDKIILENIIKP